MHSSLSTQTISPCGCVEKNTPPAPSTVARRASSGASAWKTSL